MIRVIKRLSSTVQSSTYCGSEETTTVSRTKVTRAHAGTILPCMYDPAMFYSTVCATEDSMIPLPHNIVSALTNGKE